MLFHSSYFHPPALLRGGVSEQSGGSLAVRASPLCFFSAYNSWNTLQYGIFADSQHT